MHSNLDNSCSLNANRFPDGFAVHCAEYNCAGEQQLDWDIWSCHSFHCSGFATHLGKHWSQICIKITKWKHSTEQRHVIWGARLTAQSDLCCLQAHLCGCFRVDIKLTHFCNFRIASIFSCTCILKQTLIEKCRVVFKSKLWFSFGSVNS